MATTTLKILREVKGCMHIKPVFPVAVNTRQPASGKISREFVFP